MDRGVFSHEHELALADAAKVDQMKEREREKKPLLAKLDLRSYFFCFQLALSVPEEVE
jgi:hypothetical protein